MTRWTLHEGDCLDILPGVAPLSVDAVITDPPYMIGASSVGDPGAKSGTWADTMNVARWYADWLRLCQRALRPTGHAIVFCNWRTIPTLLRAFDLCGWGVTSCLLWDKEWIGPGGTQGFRPQHEVILHAAMPQAQIANRGLPDVVRHKWMAGNMRTTAHPAEKPVGVLRWLVEATTSPGALVVDPFAGSGTTGVAAVAAGRRFVGIESEARWVALARERLDDATAQGGLPLVDAAP